MNNQKIKLLLTDCGKELNDMRSFLNNQKNIKFTTLTKYLTNYAIIKSCGTIEFAYKTIIADYFDANQNKHVKHFIHKKVRSISKNPCLETIKETLKDFDSNLDKQFHDKLKTNFNHEIWCSSLHNLKNARNELAHGGSPTITLNTVINYYSDSCKIIKILDDFLETKDVDFENLFTLFNS